MPYPSIRGVTVSWAECLRDIAGTAQRLIDEGGPDQVGCYVGTGAATDPTGAMFLPKLMHAIGSRQWYSASTVDIAPMFRAAEMVTGFASVFPSWDPESLDEPIPVGTVLDAVDIFTFDDEARIATGKAFWQLENARPAPS